MSSICFQSPLKPPAPNDLTANFKFVSQPEVALRVKELQIQRKIKSLIGLKFADTPGTDSLITHHQNLARQYIEDKPGSPIIFLFDGKYPGGEAEVGNILFLNSLRQAMGREFGWERVFFVITKRGIDIRPNEKREVVGRVHTRLKEVGLEKKRIYFVDSIEAQMNPNDADVLFPLDIPRKILFSHWNVHR